MITQKNGHVFIPHDLLLSHRDDANASLMGLVFVPTIKSWKVLGTRDNILNVNRIFGSDFELQENKITLAKFMLENNFSFVKAPYQHQVDALLDCNSRKYYAYFLEPGLGKTKILIDDVRALYGVEKVDTVLVLAPKSVMRSWEREIALNSAESTVSCWPGVLPEGDNIRWYIMNPAALTTKIGHDN
jgi:hypothetical protein